ncbi:Uncharacterised protein [Mycobacteroides abscessus subsp. abscessus]|nr:Uncharacterised protein [Mycobacteroides abscessus subsp. abscessus]
MSGLETPREVSAADDLDIAPVEDASASACAPELCAPSSPRAPPSAWAPALPASTSSRAAPSAWAPALPASASSRAVRSAARRRPQRRENSATPSISAPTTIQPSTATDTAGTIESTAVRPVGFARSGLAVL